MKKFLIAGFAAIAIAALAPQTQAAPQAKRSAPAALTHAPTKAAPFHGAPDRRLAAKRVDPHGRDVKVAREDRFARDRHDGRDGGLVRDERARHDEELRRDRFGNLLHRE